MPKLTDSRYRIQAFAGKALIRIIEFILTPFLPDQSFFKSADFDWTKTIDSNWERIRDEALSVRLRQNGMFDICDISPEQYKVVDRGDWDFFPLYAYGVPFLDNLDACPETKKLVDSIPDRTTVFFSILKPGTHVKAHRGAYRGYLRYHLGLSVPDPQSCGLKLKDKTYRWHNGESMIFDDTFDHEAWNKGTEDRVILYVDFIRPLPIPFRFISLKLTELISRSPFIQGGLERAGQIAS